MNKSRTTLFQTEITDWNNNIENLFMVRAIRRGLVMIIPFIIAGAFAIMLQSLPIPPYQDFLLHTAVGRALGTILLSISSATFGFLSVLISFTIGTAIQSELSHGEEQIHFVPLVVLCCFLLSVNIFSRDFDRSALGSAGMFIAILNAALSSTLYIWLLRHARKVRIFSDGSNPLFDQSLLSIPAVSATVLFFAVLDHILCAATHSQSTWEMFASLLKMFFDHMGDSFAGGLLYVAISMGLWFFGIHGADMLDTANNSIFIPNDAANAAAAEAGMTIPHLYTKTFYDVFVLMGGCGTTLCLVIALLLYSHRRNNRILAKVSLFPMIFNINEIMVFGLPIVYNLILLIPFLLTPIACFCTATVAVKTGLVPPVTATVQWTTPVFIGGYIATGSIAGSILQLVNLCIGALIYAPFVKLYDRVQEKKAISNIRTLIAVYTEHEAAAQPIVLTELPGIPGEIARVLIHDLKSSMKDRSLFLLYQPQVNHKGELIGAEALLRWNHPIFGYIYPPVIIQLAYESGLLPDLERYIFLLARENGEQYGQMKISVNISAVSLKDESFIDFLADQFPGGTCHSAPICVEVTERAKMDTRDEITNDHLARLKVNGFLLAIDDFSMGQTSISYLKNSQFDIVKLDGFLTKNVETDDSARDIIASLVHLSEKMGFAIIAEYVETEKQRRVLEDLGVCIYQGYLYSKPVSFEELQSFAASRKPLS